MAKVLLATGVEEIDKKLTEYITNKEKLGIEIVGELYYREAVNGISNECEIIVISEELPGSENFVNETIYKLRMRGIRVIILVGDDKIENVELIQSVVSLGIYDLIYNPVTVEKITEKILRASTLADIPDNYLKPAKETPERSNLPRDKTIAMLGKRLKIFGRNAELEDRNESILCFPPNGKDNNKLLKAKLPEGFVLFGDVPGLQCSNSIIELSLANPKAILVLADDKGFIDEIKALRREYKLISVPIVVVGECDNEVCYSAGADECIETLDEKAVLRIQSKSKQMREIWANALKDDLTGLYKRNFLNEYLSEQERRYEDAGVPFSLLLADLDHFKGVNDTYGHQAGDDVLKKFATFLQDGVRKVDVVARYGGEEFVVVFPGTGIKGALPVAERLRQLWEKQKIVLPSGAKINCTFSAGMAEFNGSVQDVEALINFADRALYRAKEAGRNRISIAGDRPRLAAKMILVSGPEGAFIASNLAASLTWQGGTVCLVDLSPELGVVSTFSAEPVELEQVTEDLAGAWKKGGRPRELPGLLLISGTPDMQIDDLSRGLPADFIIVHTGEALIDYPIKDEVRIIHAYKNDRGSVVIRMGDGSKETFLINMAHLSSEMDRASKRRIPVMLLSPELADAFSILSQNILKGGNKD